MRKILVLLALALVMLTAANIWITQDNTLGGNSEDIGQGIANIGGAFTLTDQNERRVSNTDFEGRVMLVFFGFTHCPDICPVTVATLAEMLNDLGQQAQKVAPVFITVDPKRDTPRVLREYLAGADERIIGLTGTEEEIAQAAEVYKAYYSVNNAPQTHEPGEEAAEAGTEQTESDEHSAHDHGGAEESEVLVDHSGIVYMMGIDGKYIRHFSYDVPAEELVGAINDYLK